MVDGQERDSSRHLLEELEGGWGTPPPPGTEPSAPSLASVPNAQTKARAAEPSERRIASDIDALDDGWLDDDFPGDDGHDPDDPEPELPDERLDPVAFALAKKAREEHAARKKERRRTKIEAKRARQKARAMATRQKQKAKKRNRPAAAPPASTRERAIHAPRPATGAKPNESDATVIAAPVPSRSAKRPSAGRPSTTASIKLLAIVLATLLALAAAVAAIMK